MIETVRPYTVRDNMRVAIFDFDGTLSLLRSGWMPMMVSMFMSELTSLHTQESEAALRKLTDDIVFTLTGKDTIYQMAALADEVRKRGGNPPSAAEYKAAFLRDLLQLVKSRLASLREGRVAHDHFLVPGSRALLELLQERAVTLYLASGTDHEHLLEEAEALEITRYFDERIYGATSDPRGFTKAALVAHLLDAGYHRDELVMFGDGTVEIGEASKAGGMAVGLATKEPECLTVDEEKRRHLIAAGANFIIPNYQDVDGLIDMIVPGRRVFI